MASSCYGNLIKLIGAHYYNEKLLTSWHRGTLFIKPPTWPVPSVKRFLGFKEPLRRDLNILVASLIRFLGTKEPSSWNPQHVQFVQGKRFLDTKEPFKQTIFSPLYRIWRECVASITSYLINSVDNALVQTLDSNLRRREYRSRAYSDYTPSRAIVGDVRRTSLEVYKQNNYLQWIY